jgi:hypothetical protein
MWGLYRVTGFMYSNTEYVWIQLFSIYNDETAAMTALDMMKTSSSDTLQDSYLDIKPMNPNFRPEPCRNDDLGSWLELYGPRSKFLKFMCGQYRSQLSEISKNGDVEDKMLLGKINDMIGILEKINDDLTSASEKLLQHPS